MKENEKTNVQLTKEIEILNKKVIDLEKSQKKNQATIQANLEDKQELLIQSNRNQLIFETTMDSYILADTDGKIIEINQAYCDLIGYSREELLKMNIRQLEASMPSEEVEHRIQKMVSLGKDRFETKHKHKDGYLLDLETSISILNEVERPMIAAIMRDITQRKKAENALRDNEYLLREAQKVAALGYYKLDIQSGVWESSSHLDSIFGIDKEYNKDVNGWIGIIHPDDQAEMQDYFLRSVLENHVSFDKEYRIISMNDHQERWVHGLGQLEIGDNGDPVKMIGTIQDITDRKNAEKELQESEFRFRTIIEQATDALYISDFEGNLVEVNNKACENLGYSKDELRSMKIGDITEKYDDADFRKSVLIKLLHGETTILESFQRRKDGSVFPVEISLSIIELSRRKVILGFARDITERKKAEEVLLKMNMAIDNSSEVILMTDKEGIITFVNPEFTKMYGYTAEEVVGKVTPRILKSGHVPLEITKQLWDALLNKQSIPASEYVNRCKDNKLIDIEGSANPILDDKGEILGFLGIQRDITKRKRTEHIQSVLYKISNAVNTTDNLENLISIIQKELGLVIDTSNFYVALYDETTDTISLPFFVDEKDKIDSIPAGKTLTKYVIETQKSLLIDKEEIRNLENAGIIGKFGTEPEIWLGVPLKNNGKVTGILAIQSYSDGSAYNESDMKMLEFVSDQISVSIFRKKAEQELIEALEKAKESDRLKSTFLATMSHELRTPLNAIIGFSDIINEELSVTEIVDFVKIINSSGNQLLGIVEDLFDITLIEAGEIRIRKRKVTLYSIMEYVYNVIEVDRQTTSKEHIELKLFIENEDRDLIIDTDPVKLKQILINLLRNALKFTQEGHVHFGCKVVIEDNSKAILFYVEDTGKGIPENKRDLIFDIFAQIEDTTTTAFGGTGIGLSISKKLTVLLGGKIWVESELDKGSVFKFSIPYTDGRIEEISNQTEIESDSGRTDKLINRTVLVAEDDEASYTYLKIILENKKIKPIWAKSGLEAVQHCKENSEIDLVLMDINMPEMDGYEATQEIKKYNPKITIIAQTAYAVEGDHEKSIEAGCDDYISKPIKKDVLMSKLEKYLAK